LELLRQREAVAERAQRQAARLAALFNLSRIMGTEIDVQNVFDAVTQICREAFTCDRASLMLVDRDTQELVVRSASGHRDPDKVVGTRQKIGEGVAGHVAANGKPVVLGPGALDSDKFQRLRTPQRPLEAAIVVPIQTRGELVGVLSIASHQTGAAFDAEDLQALLVFAENVGSCIRHAEQAEWMRQLIRRHTNAAPGAAQPAARTVG
jgi:GAF domain-containing protein